MISETELLHEWMRLNGWNRWRQGFKEEEEVKGGQELKEEEQEVKVEGPE